MQNMITFPLYDFDMSDYVAFKEPNKCYKYDLFGIVVSALFPSQFHSRTTSGP